MPFHGLTKHDHLDKVRFVFLNSFEIPAPIWSLRYRAILALVYARHYFKISQAPSQPNGTIKYILLQEYLHFFKFSETTIEH